MHRDGTIQIDLEETQANTSEGEVEMATRVTRVDHSQKSNPTKKGYLRLKVSPERFAELKQRAKEAEQASSDREKKERAYWRERMNSALPAFLRFAKEHAQHQLTFEECEPIAPMIEAIRRGKKLSPNEQVKLVSMEQPGVWQIHLYRDGKLEDIREYTFKDTE